MKPWMPEVQVIVLWEDISVNGREEMGTSELEGRLILKPDYNQRSCVICFQSVASLLLNGWLRRKVCRVQPHQVSPVV